MWTSTTNALSRDTHHYAPRRDGQPIPYADVLTLWQSDDSFRSFFIKLLADSPFPAFRFETPPITRSTATCDFEFVLIDTPSLPRTADPQSFAAHFSNDASVVAFPNLGKDATLIVPCPRGPADHYAHLAPFLRHAPAEQIHAFWQLAGATLQSQLADQPLWLSTAGLGVSWLHLRIDLRPKYYTHGPYRASA